MVYQDKTGGRKPPDKFSGGQSHNGTESQFTEERVLHTSDYQQLIDLVKTYTRELVDKNISTHQLRNIFNEANRAKSASELWKLEVKLAYLAGRNESNRKFKDFTEMLTRLIRATNDDTLRNFKEFLTALVAYHKYHEKFSKGGRE
jgi:CRISPR-associated protein Csm2